MADTTGRVGLTVDDIARLHIDKVLVYRSERRPDPVPLRVEIRPEAWNDVRRNASDHWLRDIYTPGVFPSLGVPVVVRSDLRDPCRIIYLNADFAVPESAPSPTDSHGDGGG